MNLLKVAKEALTLLENYEEKIEGEWGCRLSLEQLEAKGQLPLEIINLRAAISLEESKQ